MPHSNLREPPVSLTEPVGHNAGMHRFLQAFIFALAINQTAVAASFDPIRDVVERHVRIQTQGLNGKLDIRIGAPDTSRLPDCTTHEAFTPTGVRMIGKTTVGVRCLGPSAWNILVPVQISVLGTYLTTARALMAGQIIQPGDLVVQEGDISNLPTGLVADIGSALGKSLRVSLGAGQLIRSDALLAPLVIRQNQIVKVISRGQGFAASAEGKAMTNASLGQSVNVRMNSGQVVSGIALANGTVEISY